MDVKMVLGKTLLGLAAIGTLAVLVNQKSRGSSKIEDLTNQPPLEPEMMPIMTYDSAIKYFVTERPSDPKVKKGAILRQEHSQGYLLTQVFLDGDNEVVYGSDRIPYGRRVVAKEIDEELDDSFGKTNLIVIE